MISRRDAIKSIAFASALGSVALSQSDSLTAAGSESRNLRILDTHQHLWDLKKFRLPWTDGDKKMSRSYVVSDYLTAIKGTGIEQAVYMEVGMAAEQRVEEAEYVIGLCREKESLTRAAVIAGDPRDEGFDAYVRRFAKEKEIRGIRHLLQIPESPKGICTQPDYVKKIQLLGELGLSFDLCMRPTELDDGAKLVKEAPETRFIVDHCGNADVVAFTESDKRWREPQHEADQWKRSMDGLAKYPNVICKISGIIARVQEGKWEAGDLAPIVNHCLDTFGPDRVIFASDWPVCTLGAPLVEWVTALKTIVADRPLTEVRKLFYDNAQRFYKFSV